MRTVLVIARQTFQECVRRRVFIVVPIATVAFLALFTLGTHFAFRSTFNRPGVVIGSSLDVITLTGGSLLGLSMFVTLFLGSAVGIFLTFNTVRGDAEQGVLQPVVVRPVARWGLIGGRFLGTSLICVAYVLFLYAASVAITHAIGGWHPEAVMTPGLQLAAAVVVVIALTLLGSVFLTSLTNGIGMFMLYGAGLLAGLLGQLGKVLNSAALETTGRVASYALPFEALYQQGLYSLTADTSGFTRVVIELGPLGGAREGGPLLGAWTIVYIGIVGAITLFGFARRDL